MQTNKVLRRSVLVLLLSPGLALAGGEKGGHGGHWGYSGPSGPEHWGDLSPEFAACGEGTQQSPIDIRSPIPSKLDKISFSYKPSALEIVNNGHTIQVNYEPGSTISIGQQSYELLQFHFHTPSEHKINGTPAPKELHLVHKNSKGELAVVGVLMTEGAHHSALESIREQMPHKAGEKKKNAGATIDASQLLPKKQKYHHYMGSLTTPPCSEIVNWYVLEQPVEVSRKQLEAFQTVMGENARPVQPLKRRFVLSAN